MDESHPTPNPAPGPSAPAAHHAPDTEPDTDDREHEEDTPRGVLETIELLKQGRLTGRSVSIDTRRAVVEYLVVEGLGVPEIAKLFVVSEKTISRDIVALRKANALKVGPEFKDEMLGELVSTTRTCVLHTRRAMRDKSASPADRIAGNRAIAEMLDRLTQRLQSVGHLPTAAQGVYAEVVHMGVNEDASAVLAKLNEQLKAVQGLPGAKPHAGALQNAQTVISQLITVQPSQRVVVDQAPAAIKPPVPANGVPAAAPTTPATPASPAPAANPTAPKPPGGAA